MVLNLAILAIYLSFSLDFIIWPISSEASTKSLIKVKNEHSLLKSFGLIAVFLANLIFYLAPLALAIQGLLASDEAGMRSLPLVGVLLAIVGRLLSLKGTLILRANTQSTLVTTSIFKRSRNPISTGMHLTILGLVLCFGQWYLWLGLVLYILNIHLKIKIEEKFLLNLHGPFYRDYVLKTPRYLIW
ncbi:MAG: hypothetical protein JXR03_19700 [Cyclobacteriaceae bacterium]